MWSVADRATSSTAPEGYPVATSPRPLGLSLSDATNTTESLPHHPTHLVTVEPLGTDHVIRLPDPTAKGRDGLLGQANRRRLDDARAALTALVSRPDALINPGTAGAGLELDLDLTGPEVAACAMAALAHDDMRMGRLTLLDGGTAGTAPPELGVNFDRTYGVDRPNLGDLAHWMGQGHGARLGAMEVALGWTSFAGALETLAGLAVEVSVLILGPGGTYPLPRNRRGSTTVIAVDQPITTTRGVLGPGAAVALPVGTDETFSVTDLTFALQVDVQSRGPMSMHQASLTAAHFHPLLRADLPADLTEPSYSFGGAAWEHPDQLLAELDQVLGPHGQALAAAQSRALLPARPTTDLLTVIEIGTNLRQVRCPLPGGVMAARSRHGEHLAAASMAMTLADGLTELIAPHLDGRPSDTSTWGLDPDTTAAVVDQLVLLELLEPVP